MGGRVGFFITGLLPQRYCNVLSVSLYARGRGVAHVYGEAFTSETPTYIRNREVAGLGVRLGARETGLALVSSPLRQRRLALVWRHRTASRTSGRRYFFHGGSELNQHTALL
ncbi:unnamed protein product [Laminaria digitata]